MKIKLSKELVWVLKTLQGKISVSNVTEPIEYIDNHGIKKACPGVQYVQTTIDLSENKNVYNDLIECEKWMNTISTYFSTSYKAYRIDIGPFIGLYPVKIDMNEKLICFHAEDFHYEPTWRDWFIPEGDVYASEFTIELLSDVCNSR